MFITLTQVFVSGTVEYFCSLNPNHFFFYLIGRNDVVHTESMLNVTIRSENANPNAEDYESPRSKSC